MRIFCVLALRGEVVVLCKKEPRGPWLSPTPYIHRVLSGVKETMEENKRHDKALSREGDATAR